jgi:DNA-binding MarR family transcriptional regulator
VIGLPRELPNFWISSHREQKPACVEVALPYVENVAFDNDQRSRYTGYDIVAQRNELMNKEALMGQHPSTGALLREVARLHVQLQRTCVAYCGGTTTTQCTVLTELGRSGPVTLAELARRIGFDKSWTSRAVEHLVQDGLVEKVLSQQDRRTVRLSLSPAGEVRLVDLNHTLNALANQAFEHIPPDQHANVHSSLELLQQALLTLTVRTAAGDEEGETACGRE